MRHLLSPYFNISLLAALLTSALMLSLSSSAQEPPPNPPKPERPATKKEKVSEMFGLIREEMPLFPGCEDRPDYASRKSCADSLLLDFVYSNLRYPYAAWRDSVQGMAVVSFVVEKDGSVAEPKAVRDPGRGTGAEAVRIVNLMVKRGIRWTPGTQMGKPVRVQFNLPVKFRMGDHEFPPPPPPPPPMNCSDIFKVVDEMPHFPGCEDIGDAMKRKQCSDTKLLSFLYGNFKYPGGCSNCCVEGTVVISFVIEKDGTISDIKIVRGLAAGMGEAAAEAVREMIRQGIRWTPGRQQEVPVRVQYNVPIRIKLK